MDNNPTQTDVADLLANCNAGIFERKIGRALSDVAGGVIETGKTGKVTITLDLKRISESNQINIKHQIKLSMPTKNGSQTQEDTTATPMHVGRGGRITAFPETQGNLEFKISQQTEATS